MIILADSVSTFEGLLQGQVGVVLGMVIFYFLMRPKLDEVIASNKATQNATNRQTRTIALLLIATDITPLRTQGHDIISDIDEEAKGGGK